MTFIIENVGQTETYIHLLRQALQDTLPGTEAHLIMAPAGREIVPPAHVTPKHAAVLIPLCAIDDLIHILLTVRREDLRFHGGEISLPGGQAEPQDEACTDTALREAEEEINLPPDAVEILGMLSKLYIPPSHYLIHPIVGWIPELPLLSPQEREVAHILRIPLSHLARKANRRREWWILGDKKVQVPYYDYKRYKIWGATAMILSELLLLHAPLPQTSRAP